MIHSSIAVWLFALGGVTSLLAVQFVAPQWYARTFNKISDLNGSGLFYARQAGLAIAVQGALLVWAGFDPSIRLPVAVAVASGKLAFVITILVQRKELPGLLFSAVVDGAAVVVLGLYLAGL